MKTKTIPITSNQAVSIEQISKNNKKIARTRRQRGYHWEDTIVKRFNKLENWEAFRLGSPRVALPDILTVNNQERILFTIEAKSGTNNTLQVPYDQISRCLKWTETFKVYKTRNVILAFKFLSKKRIGVGQYESRELREFFKVWHKGDEIMDCVCTYEGEVYGLKEKTRFKINLKDYEMPFEIKTPRANTGY
ncbi:MAG: resolvase [Crenarchaeota archaeon]|nr:MAG: resolvase [Thermoproteota archaeon]